MAREEEQAQVGPLDPPTAHGASASTSAFVEPAHVYSTSALLELAHCSVPAHAANLSFFLSLFLFFIPIFRFPFFVLFEFMQWGIPHLSKMWTCIRPPIYLFLYGKENPTYGVLSLEIFSLVPK